MDSTKQTQEITYIFSYPEQHFSLPNYLETKHQN